MTLLTDINSHFSNGKTGVNKNQILYGKKGDKVKLISDHDNVLIVELNGNKFPVKKEEVNNDTA